MISHAKLEQIRSSTTLPSNGVRISISAYSKNTIVQPHIYRICHALNSSLIDLHNFVDRAKTCLMICIFLPITVTQRKFCQECIINLPNLQNVSLHISTMHIESIIEKICVHIEYRQPQAEFSKRIGPWKGCSQKTNTQSTLQMSLFA